jgi:hypothetical protein
LFFLDGKYGSAFTSTSLTMADTADLVEELHVVAAGFDAGNPEALVWSAVASRSF